MCVCVLYKFLRFFLLCWLATRLTSVWSHDSRIQQLKVPDRLARAKKESLKRHYSVLFSRIRVSCVCVCCAQCVESAPSGHVADIVFQFFFLGCCVSLLRFVFCAKQCFKDHPRDKAHTIDNVSKKRSCNVIWFIIYIPPTWFTW